MKLDITDDHKFIVLKDASKFEAGQLKLSLTREMPNSFVVKKINPNVNTKRCFINNYGLIPFGLWVTVMGIAKRYGIPIELSDSLKACTDFSKSITYEEFESYVSSLFSKCKDRFFPKPYQIEAAWKAIKYKNDCVEISTSGGKTLISYIIFKWLLDNGVDNILYIVPSIDLASQSAEKYYMYEGMIEGPQNFEIAQLRSGLNKAEKDKIENSNVLFATFQSLSRKKPEFFDRFKCVICDECHHSSSKSVSNVISKCRNLEYKIGMTGTFPRENEYNNLYIQSIIGPVIYRLTASQLINKEKFGTPIYIIFDLLDWATADEKATLHNMRVRGAELDSDITIYTKLLKDEQLFVNNSEKRLKYICDLVASSKKNSMVLFGDIKYGYGKKIYERLKSYSGKDVFYVDGSTPPETRDFYKQKMEDDTDGNTVLIASIGTMGEGIDVKNLWNIFLVNTAKSERIIRQICGRGLRNYPGKDKVLLFDFVDDLRFSLKGQYKKDNYMWKHYKSRDKIYTEQGFPVYKRNIRL